MSEKKFKTLEHRKLCYEEICGSGTSSGPPLLFLHGNPGNRNDFRRIAASLSSEGQKCILLDRPGHGESDCILFNKTDPAGSISMYLDFITKIASPEVLIIGYSIGAFHALKIAIKAEKLVRGLILIAPYIKPRDISEKTSGLPALSEKPVTGYLLKLFLPFLAARKLREHLSNTFSPASPPPEERTRFEKEFINAREIISLMNDRNELLATFSDTISSLSKLKIPVLLIAGEKDKISNGSEQTSLIEREINLAGGKAKSVIIEGAGHALPFTHPEELLKHISSFLVSLNQTF